LIKYEWICEKTAYTGFLNAARLPMKSHENVVVFSSQQNIYNAQMLTGKRRRNGGRTDTISIYGKVDRCYKDNGGKYFPKSIMRFPNGHHEGSTNHSSQKPVALYEYLIRTYTNEDDTVLDFCAGSGTTGVAAIKTGRNAILIDKEPKYFEIMQRRIEEAQRQMLLSLP
jgi:site-specific DNA-methyltransferase (adenine-specific)